jgi:dimethylaniline monooxygenase (N-oxide forming)
MKATYLQQIHDLKNGHFPSSFTMKVAIIGSGLSGLAAMKCCLDEGLEPVCFEQEDTIGGLWNFAEEERHSSVYRSTVSNVCKEMMCFSDFPHPKEFPPFLHNTKVMEYFHLYAKHFDLYKYIRYETKVKDIRKAADYDKTGNWEVCYASLVGPEANVVKKEVYNAVMLCTGHHSSPYWPSFQGMDDFGGIKLHSHAYKDFKRFEGKSVLVVGEYQHGLY